MHDLTPTAEAAENFQAGRQAGSLLALVQRIEDAIEAETAGIRSDPGFDIKGSNARKSRHLFELGKAFKTVRPEDLDAGHREAMQRLRRKLTANEAAIRAHLTAVGEVAGLLQDAIERAQADGTYSVREFGQR